MQIKPAGQLSFGPLKKRTPKRHKRVRIQKRLLAFARLARLDLFQPVFHFDAKSDLWKTMAKALDSRTYGPLAFRAKNMGLFWRTSSRVDALRRILAPNRFQKLEKLIIWHVNTHNPSNAMLVYSGMWVAASAMVGLMIIKDKSLRDRLAGDLTLASLRGYIEFYPRLRSEIEHEIVKLGGKRAIRGPILPPHQLLNIWRAICNM